MTDNQKSIINYVNTLLPTTFIPIEYGGVKVMAGGLSVRISGIGGIKNSDLVRKLQFLVPEHQGLREQLLTQGLYVEECCCCGADTNDLVEVREGKVAPICTSCMNILCNTTIHRGRG